MQITLIEKSVASLLTAIGEDVSREGLIETPQRVAKSWASLLSGYNEDPKTILKTFSDGACDEMVLLRNIEFYSMCEHHMLPFYGKAHIAYLPNQRVVGLSKLARLLEIYAKRLQIQERLTTQITSALDEILDSKGSACILVAKHLCVCCRGVNKQEAEMVTSSLTGAFRLPEVRSEFLQLIQL